MKGFEFNKIFAALLVAMLVASLSGFISHKLVAPEKLEKNAYVVEGVGAPVASEAATTAPAGPPPIAPLLAAANLEAGQKYARVCGTCHSFNKGEPNRVGPNLYGIVGAPHAHAADYTYSDAMKGMHDHVWDFEELNEFLYNPRAHLPGTKMTYAGIKSDTDRANVIAWLRTLSDSPTALPK